MADEKKKEKSHEVKDKRRVNPDGSLKETAEAEASASEVIEEQPIQEQPAETQPEETAKATGPESEQQAEAPHAHEEIPTPDVFETLQFVTGLLAEQAWQFMGLHLPPGRKEPVTDMAQAKIAIDTVIFVADKLHPHLGDEERRAIRGIIGDLQLNFVQRNR